MALTRPEQHMIWSKRLIAFQEKVGKQLHDTYCIRDSYMPLTRDTEKTELQSQYLKEQWKEFQAFIASTDAPEIPE